MAKAKPNDVLPEGNDYGFYKGKQTFLCTCSCGCGDQAVYFRVGGKLCEAQTDQIRKQPKKQCELYLAVEEPVVYNPDWGDEEYYPHN